VSSPDFVVIGHVVRDVQPDGWRLGGTVTFAAVQAVRLGMRAGIVTRMSDDVDDAALRAAVLSADVTGRPSHATTTFENSYAGADRTQRIFAQSDAVAEEDVPASWRDAPLVLLGPVCREVPADAARWFDSELIGASAQGWLREAGAEQEVTRTEWQGDEFWKGCHAVFVSLEDLSDDVSVAEEWGRSAPVVVVTSDRRGARLHAKGSWQSIDAFPAHEVDPTGAGDVFAAAFLVRYHETSNLAAAARFASAAAACAVEAKGAEGVAERATIEDRMAAYPEIVLR
jgi:sugar/nucleoside kinase (ribokinase family)